METQTKLQGFLFTYLFYQVNKLPAKNIPENSEEHALEAVDSSSRWVTGFQWKVKYVCVSSA